MTIPFKSLTEEQRVWYAHTVLSAILADQEINISEVEFLKEVIGLIRKAEDRADFMRHAENKEMPPILPPPEPIADKMVAAIFIELILIVISDIDFADGERAFLKNVSEAVGFSDSYYRQMMRWCEEGLAWKKQQRSLIPGASKLVTVPLKDMSPDQKRWYATCLISCILVDGLVDSSEMSFLKMAISFVEDPKDQKELIAYVRNKMCPEVKTPVGLGKDVLSLIFIELILIISADETMSFKEQNHLKDISDLCGFGDAKFKHMLEWCNRGILWKNGKNSLIAKVQRTQVVRAHVLPTAPENSSLFIREVYCAVCENPDPITFYQLKPRTQKPKRNIYGIPGFYEALPGHALIDYNQAGICICPNCLFASNTRFHFVENLDDPVPETFSDEKLRSYWLGSIDQRREKFGEGLNEISKLDRSLETVVNAYEVAIEACELMNRVTVDQEYAWAANSHRLILAEILTHANQQNMGDLLIKDSMQSSEKIFKKGLDQILGLKAARILLIAGFYFSNREAVGYYLDFFKKTSRNVQGMKEDEAKVFKKIYGEIGKIYDHRTEYTRKNMDGLFMRDLV